MAKATLCSLSVGSYSGQTGHADRFGSLLCHRLYRQEYHSPSGLEAASAKELPPCNHQHFRQTAKKPQAASLFRQWHEFSCSGLRVFCRCCLMSDFYSLSYSTTCLHVRKCSHIIFLFCTKCYCLNGLIIQGPVFSWHQTLLESRCLHLKGLSAFSVVPLQNHSQQVQIRFEQAEYFAEG